MFDAIQRNLRPALSVTVLTAGFGLLSAGAHESPERTRPPRYVANVMPAVGGSSSAALATDSRGRTAGWSEDGFRRRQATIWTRGGLEKLGTLMERDAGASEAWDVNVRGQMTGWSHTEGSRGTMEQHAFLWENGVMRDLGTLSGGTRSQGVGMNVRGEVAGWSTTDGADLRTRRAFLVSRGGMQDLGALPGGAVSSAFAVNDRGEVVGWSTTDGTDMSSRRAFLWRNGKMTELPTLGGGLTVAYDINNRGEVVGTSRTASGDLHAFLWKDGTMTDLGTLGGSRSDARGITEAGHVLGWSTVRGSDISTRRAFVWKDGEMTELAPVDGADQSVSFDVNNRGDVVGWSRFSSGEVLATRWSLRR